LGVIYITDLAGHCSYYEGAALTAIMPHTTFTVVNNASPDTTPPAITAATILTPTVKLSAAYPYARVDVTVTDNLSGAQYVAATFENAAQTQTISLQSDAAAPTRKGVIEIGSEIGGEGSSPTGTYTVTNVEACDIAGNCFFVEQGKELAKIFGSKTSFTMTK
jgi:hypothetical protein